MELYDIIRLAAEGVLVIYAGCMLYRSCKWEKRAVENKRAFNASVKEAQRAKLEAQKVLIDLYKANDEVAKYRVKLGLCEEALEKSRCDARALADEVVRLTVAMRSESCEEGEENEPTVCEGGADTEISDRTSGAGSAESGRGGV